MLKQLLADGIGAEKKQARVITEEEEGILWEKKVLGCHSPTSLLHTIFYFCGMYFCLRGGAEHRELKLSQLEVQVSSNGVKCLVYREHGSKNHQGLTQQLHLNNKIVHHYADDSLGVDALSIFLSFMFQNFQLLPKNEICSIVNQK